MEPTLGHGPPTCPTAPSDNTGCLCLVQASGDQSSVSRSPDHLCDRPHWDLPGSHVSVFGIYNSPPSALTREPIFVLLNHLAFFSLPWFLQDNHFVSEIIAFCAKDSCSLPFSCDRDAFPVDGPCCGRTSPSQGVTPEQTQLR